MRNISAHKNKGMALVEVIAAVGIAAVVITSMVSLSLYTLRSSLSAKLQLQATKVATKESEMVRAFRDSVSWSDFINSIKACGISTMPGCNIVYDGLTDTFGPGSGSAQEGSGVEVVFRYFTASNLSGGMLSDTDSIARITVTAYYNIAGVSKYTHIYTDLTNWKVE